MLARHLALQEMSAPGGRVRGRRQVACIRLFTSLDFRLLPNYEPWEPPMNKATHGARRLRQRQTKAESLLWSALRAGKLCGLKFRRQHPIGPFFADFACCQHSIVIEIDGPCHNDRIEDDRRRQSCLEREGWCVMRFSNDDVLNDVDAVARSIAKRLDLEANFHLRGVDAERSGMFASKSATHQ
ncbi:MAG: endonuclease domain-containing protein [Planctomycetaceae bacterium]